MFHRYSPLQRLFQGKTQAQHLQQGFQGLRDLGFSFPAPPSPDLPLPLWPLPLGPPPPSSTLWPLTLWPLPLDPLPPSSTLWFLLSLHLFFFLPPPHPSTWQPACSSPFLLRTPATLQPHLTLLSPGNLPWALDFLGLLCFQFLQMCSSSLHTPVLLTHLLVSLLKCASPFVLQPWGAWRHLFLHITLWAGPVPKRTASE